MFFLVLLFFGDAMTTESIEHFATDWKTLLLDMKVHPEKEDEALLFLRRLLGYLPRPEIYSPHMPFMRTLHANCDSGIITEDTLADELDFHIKRVRNDDLKKSGNWQYKKMFSQAMYDFYESHLPEFKEVVRDRMKDFIGYYVDLEYSLEAELFMRECFNERLIAKKSPYDDIDLRAATVALYRETLFLHGEDEADDMLLLGWEIEIKKSKRKQEK